MSNIDELIMTRNDRKKAIKRLKVFLQENYPSYQAFDTRNIAGDDMETVYDKDGITVDHCRFWGYLEIFGLTDAEYNKLIKKGSAHKLKNFRV